MTTEHHVSKKQKTDSSPSSSTTHFFAPPTVKSISEKKQVVVDIKEVNQLLKLVVEGKQQEAEKLIQEKPSLLLSAGKVTDLSGRTFGEVTAFQYAVWALDWHMWKMLLKYLKKEEAALQYLPFTDGGRGLGDKGQHGYAFSLSDLIQEMKEYLTKTKAGQETKNDKFYSDENTRAHWEKIKEKQHLLPMHVVNECCRLDKPFDTKRTFQEDDLPRTSKLNVEGDWYASEWVNISQGGAGSAGVMPINKPFFKELPIIQHEIEMFSLLSEVRNKQRSELNQEMNVTLFDAVSKAPPSLVAIQMDLST